MSGRPSSSWESTVRSVNHINPSMADPPTPSNNASRGNNHAPATTCPSTTYGDGLKQGMGPGMAAADLGPLLSVARQNQAILDFLANGISPNALLGYVQHFKIAVWTGKLEDLITLAAYVNLHDLTIMAAIPVDELTKRVNAIAERQTLSGAEALATLKHKSPNEGPNPPYKRARKSLKSTEPSSTGPPEPTLDLPMGCPGGGGDFCTVRQTTYWKSEAGYIKHLLKAHLGDYKDGDVLKCLLCKGTDLANKQYPLQGSMLGVHIWRTHMMVKEGSKRAQAAVVAMEDEAGESSGTQYGHTSGIGLDAFAFHTSSVGSLYFDRSHPPTSSGF
ncbi:hypothetical protein G6011_06752 [Alternaria panax]|uniref:Uncharacterized protein n=1 Tax=Alternaria panax TaxID=48097 RepID=A0AAD4I9V8_9PLEO|nr:hypothetical protein G6011_06752 [Alternaria panax]